MKVITFEYLNTKVRYVNNNAEQKDRVNPGLVPNICIRDYERSTKLTDSRFAEKRNAGRKIE